MQLLSILLLGALPATLALEDEVPQDLERRQYGYYPPYSPPSYKTTTARRTTRSRTSRTKKSTTTARTTKSSIKPTTKATTSAGHSTYVTPSYPPPASSSTYSATSRITTANTTRSLPTSTAGNTTTSRLSTFTPSITTYSNSSSSTTFSPPTTTTPNLVSPPPVTPSCTTYTGGTELPSYVYLRNGQFGVFRAACNPFVPFAQEACPYICDIVGGTSNPIRQVYQDVPPKYKYCPATVDGDATNGYRYTYAPDYVATCTACPTVTAGPTNVPSPKPVLQLESSYQLRQECGAPDSIPPNNPCPWLCSLDAYEVVKGGLPSNYFKCQSEVFYDVVKQQYVRRATQGILTPCSPCQPVCNGTYGNGTLARRSYSPRRARLDLDSADKFNF